MIHLPSINRIYEGSTPVSKIMQGDEQVWPYRWSHPLPEYVDCGCIKGDGSGNAFIELPFNTSMTLKYRFRGSFDVAVGSTHLGAYGLADNNDFRLFMSNNLGWTYFDVGNRRLSLSQNATPWSAGTEVDITFYPVTIYDNIGEREIGTQRLPSTCPSAPFVVNIGLMTFAGLQVWETSGGTDALVFDGVPKLRYLDGTPGIYDNVGGGFYTNAEAQLTPCYHALMIKPNWRGHKDMESFTGTSFTLVSGNDGILFTDYSGNSMDPYNATVSGPYEPGVEGARWCMVDYDEDGWARFKFDKPLYGIYCRMENGYKVAFTVVPSSVRILGGVYGLGTGSPGIRQPDGTYKYYNDMRFYIPEGVTTLTGQTVFETELFSDGSVYLPSTLTTVGTAGIITGDTEHDYSSLYPTGDGVPKLFYYNGTYDEYNEIDWRGRKTYDDLEHLCFAGYPVKCTDGIFYYPKYYTETNG